MSIRSKVRNIVEDNTTKKGKIFTFFVLIIGVGVVTVPAGLVATSLSKAREIQEEE